MTPEEIARRIQGDEISDTRGPLHQGQNPTQVNEENLGIIKQQVRSVQLTRYKDGIGIQVNGDPFWAESEFDRLMEKYKESPGFGTEEREASKTGRMARSTYR